MNGDDDAADPGVTEKGLDRVGYDRAPADLTILFGPVRRAGPLAAAGRDNDDGGLLGLGY